MTVTLTEYQAKKQEMSCNVNVIPVLKYLENLFGYESMCDIVEQVGLPISFLTRKRSWVSYDYFLALLEKMVEATHDKRAPYKAPFSIKPQSTFEELIYATYSSFLQGSPKEGYKFAFNKKFYTRFVKIGNYNIISSTDNSITVQYILNKGFRQHKNNCLAIQGFLASGPIAWGLSPSTVEHKHCVVNGSDSCIYVIKWKKKKIKWFPIVSLLLMSITISVEIFFYNKIFSIKDILLTSTGFMIVILLQKLFLSFRKLRVNEEFSYQKNNSILEALEKSEHDYAEILTNKVELEEKNKYLMVINEINRLIAEAFHYNLLLHIVTMTLLNKLDLDKGIFFQYNFSEEMFQSGFNMMKDDQIREEEPAINFDKMEMLAKSFNQMELLGYLFSGTLLSERNIKLSDDILQWLNLSEKTVVYLLPVEIPHAFHGFFLFTSEGRRMVSNDLIAMLFENVSNHLKVGFQKISSRIVVENILSSIPAYVVIFNQETYVIKYINNRFLSFPEIKGRYTKEKIIGSNIFEMLPFGEKAKHYLVRGLVNIALEKKLEYYETNLGSTVIEYSLFTIPENTESEKLIGLIMNDITEAHYFQQKILINEKLLGLGRVASGIAHEINNPLYAVLANAEELADDEKISEESRQYAEEIVEHVMNVSNIIKDLSSYSKTLRKEEFDDVDINTVIEESIKLVKYGSNFLEVVVVKNLLDLPTIKARKGEVQQIFINLLNNSVQAMDGKGRLEISSEFVNNTILITISDTP